MTAVVHALSNAVRRAPVLVLLAAVAFDIYNKQRIVLLDSLS